MTLQPLFFYGTLRDPDILAATLGRAVSMLDLIPAVAPNYAAVYFPGQVYPALVHRIGEAAPGLLMLSATHNDRAALDAFEGDEYHRGRLRVITATGPFEAEVYFPAMSIPLTAVKWTLEHWTLHHKPLVIDCETAAAVSARLGLLAPGNS